jgi:hypothetical protein
MRSKSALIIFIILSLLAGTYYAREYVDREDLQMYVPLSMLKVLDRSGSQFTSYPGPLQETHWLFDIGIVDANGDGFLDIFTSNHNWEQYLLVSDTQGGYSDELAAWGLGQSADYPGLELSHTPPVIDKPGLYLYWQDRYFHVYAHETEQAGELRLGFQTYTKVDVISNEGFQLDMVRTGNTQDTGIPDTRFELSGSRGARLKVYPASRGVPINITLGSSIPLGNVYVGNQKVVPDSRTLELSLKDPHALTWSDYNDDGQIDLFVTRGAIGGTLRIHPDSIIQITRDELHVSRDGKTVFDEVGMDVGIEKRFCSSRHASWLDYNSDGLLDLFVNCENVGKVAGRYPKQLYRRDSENRLHNVAEMTGLSIEDHHLIDYEWLDVDNDTDIDLVSYEDGGYYLHRNENGRFAPEFVYRGEFARADHPELQGRGIAYWVFDGKLSAADYDRDGDVDVFAASKKGNILLNNKGGVLSPVDPSTLGLPTSTVSAAWVDYDNDGMIDLHTVPEGLFRQQDDQSFLRTGQLELPIRKYQAAIINWFDMDNDGHRDVLIALNENPSLKRWWEILPKDPFKWDVLTYRNTGSDNHWLQMKLIGNPGNREALGARVTVTTPDSVQMQEVGSLDGAFFSQGHYRIYFGLGKYSKVDSVKIVWSDGVIQVLNNVSGNQLLVVKKDSGE